MLFNQYYLELRVSMVKEEAALKELKEQTRYRYQ